MNKKEIEKKYDDFFGFGFWEREYKSHITIFAQQCVRACENYGKHGWTKCEDEFPEIGMPVLIETGSAQIHYAYYSAEDEFDVHIPADKKDYRKQFFKYSSRTVIKWRYLK